MSEFAKAVPNATGAILAVLAPGGLDEGTPVPSCAESKPSFDTAH